MKKATSSRIIWLTLACFLIGGCAHISQRAKYGLSKPVDCSSAKEDIEILKTEKASVGKRMVSGVRSITALGIVVGILKGDYKEGVRVAIGKYNKDLEKKIKEINETCGPS